MDIRFNAFNRYSNTGKIGASQKKSSASKSGKALSASGFEAKSDSISISSDAAGYSEVFKLSNAIRTEIDASNGAEKIASLKEAIGNGSYSVSADEVASAILERFV